MAARQPEPAAGLFTEKAFPEDEIVLTTAFNLEGARRSTIPGD